MSTLFLILSIYFLYISVFFITDTIRRFNRLKSDNGHLRYEYKNGDLNNNTLMTYLTIFSEILMCFPLVSLIGWNWYFIVPVSFILSRIILPISFTPIMFMLYPIGQILSLDGVYKHYYASVVFGVICYIVPTFYMIDGEFIEELSVDKILLAIIVIIGFISAVFVFNKSSSKVNMLEKYEYLISSLLSEPRMEIFSDAPSKTEIGFLLFGQPFMKIILEEKNNKLIVTCHTDSLENGFISKEWKFDTNKNQKEIYEEIREGLLSMVA